MPFVLFLVLHLYGRLLGQKPYQWELFVQDGELVEHFYKIKKMKNKFNLSQLEEIKGGVTKFDCTLITIASVTTSVYVPLAGWFMLGYAAACWSKV